MPRQAYIIGKTHAGEWQLIADPSEQWQERWKQFRELTAAKVHPELAHVAIYESTGTVRQVNLLTPEEGKRRDDRMAAGAQAAIESAKQQQAEKVKLAEEQAEERKRQDEERHKQHLQEIERLNFLAQNKDLHRAWDPKQHDSEKQLTPEGANQ